ncbi:MAG: hypothetical protein M0011_08645 [Elusimicrobia bacterium]|nr:hypothetical protein [Elusimicrobiota bacterium]
MTIDYADFTRASNLIHSLQGAALILLGAAEAYALDNKGRGAALAAGFALAISGVAMLAVMVAYPGGGSLEQLSAALNLRRGFYLFIAFACLFTGAGLSLLTRVAVGREGGGWQTTFLGLLAFAACLYFMMASRVNEAAWREVLARHSAIGGALLLAVLAKTAHGFSPKRALHVVWATLLLLAGLQLVAYRESDSSFGPRQVTIESSPAAGLPARTSPVK